MKDYLAKQPENPISSQEACEEMSGNTNDWWRELSYALSNSLKSETNSICFKN